MKKHIIAIVLLVNVFSLSKAQNRNIPLSSFQTIVNELASGKIEIQYSSRILRCRTYFQENGELIPFLLINKSFSINEIPINPFKNKGILKNINYLIDYFIFIIGIKIREY